MKKRLMCLALSLVMIFGLNLTVYACCECSEMPPIGKRAFIVDCDLE